jgi:hypothetical protein
METKDLYILLGVALLLNVFLVYFIVRYAVKKATQPMTQSINFLLHFKFDEMKNAGKSDQFINTAIKKMKDYKNWEVVNMDAKEETEKGDQKKNSLFVY